MSLFMHTDEAFVFPVPGDLPQTADVWKNAVFHQISLPPVPIDQNKDIWAKLWPTLPNTKEDVSPLKTKGNVGLSPLKTKGDVNPLKTIGNVDPLKTKGYVDPLKIKGSVDLLKMKEDLNPLKTKGDAKPLKGPWEKVVPVCNLCNKSVKQRGNFMSGRFGILENCNHVFCLSCIRFHCMQGQKKNFPDRPDRKCDQYPVLPFSCPLCNAKSSCIASSCMYISETPLKSIFLEQFKMEMGLVPCQWIKIGLGVCAYPNDCCGRADLGKRETSVENYCTVV